MAETLGWAEVMKATLAQTGLWHIGFDDFPQGESHLLILVYDRSDLDPDDIADLLEGPELGLKVLTMEPIPGEKVYSFVAYSPVLPSEGTGSGTYTGEINMSVIEVVTGAGVAAAQKKAWVDPDTGKDPFADYKAPEPDEEGMVPVLFGDDEILPANTWVMLYVTWTEGRSENTASVRDRVRAAGYRSFSFDMGGPTAWLVSTEDWQVPSRAIVAFNPTTKAVTARKIKAQVFPGLPVTVTFVTNKNLRGMQDAIEKLAKVKEAEDGVGDFFAWFMRNAKTILFVAAGSAVAYFGWQFYKLTNVRRRPAPRALPERKTKTEMAKAAGLRKKRTR